MGFPDGLVVIHLQCKRHIHYLSSFPGGTSGKELTCQYRRCKFYPWSGRYPGVGNGNPLQESSWKIPCTEEPSGLQSMGWQRTRQD